MSTTAMQALADELEGIVAEAEPRLRAYAAADAAAPWAPGKWSRQQVVGHLIDSAANNHQRFVRLQATPRLELPGYQQNHWVDSQHYLERSWEDVVALWAAYNRHLSHVIRRIDPGTLEHVWAYTEGDLTLRFIAEDYVRHIRHHLAQIFGESDGRAYGEAEPSA